LTKIELALEILHTRSNTAQDSKKKPIQHLEEKQSKKKNQIQVNSTAKQEKQQHRFNRCLSIGASDA